jgi:hypothetical protein
VKQEHGQVEDERRRMTEWLKVYEQERGKRDQAQPTNEQPLE